MSTPLHEANCLIHTKPLPNFHLFAHSILDFVGPFIRGYMAADLEECLSVGQLNAECHDVVGCILDFVIPQQRLHDFLHVLSRVHSCQVSLQSAYVHLVVSHRPD